jgi:hypothetical protein
VRRWLAALLLVAACGSNEASKESQARSIADAAGLPKETADFFALAVAGQSATHRVSLETTDTAGQPIQYTITQRPPDRRFDTFRADTVDSTISTGGTTYQCTRTADQWQCGELAPSPSQATEMFDERSVQDAIDGFKQRSEEYNFAIEDRVIAGVDARCLVTTPKPGRTGEAATMCLSPEGVILSLQVPSGTITATEYTTVVTADAFELPAFPTPTAN